MEKLLINANVDRANSDIQNLIQHGKSVSETILFWNSQPALKPLNNAKSVSDFLKDPLSYLDNHVISDTGVTFGTSKPDPRMIAQMFRIQYDELVRKISTSRARSLNVDLFTFEVAQCEVVLSKEGEQLVRERARQYLVDQDAIARYNRLKNLCDELNELGREYSFSGMDFNQAGRVFPFIIAIPGKAGQWSLGPNLTLIKNGSRKQVI